MNKSDLRVNDNSIEERLIDEDEEEEENDYLNENARRKMLYTNFLIMCFAFSFNHGCVVSCLAYASSELGDLLGSYGGGFMYIAYSFSSLCLGKPVVEAVGPKYGLFFGVLGFCLYVLGFMLSVIAREYAWGIFLVSSTIGGLSGGVLWTAQGKYFSANALLYAEAEDRTVEEVNSQFAGIFAVIFLGTEMATGLVASGVYFGLDDDANSVVFSIFTLISIISVVAMLLINSLDEYGSWTFEYDAMVSNATSVTRLIMADNRLKLMVPYQVSFGLVSSFVPFYIYGTVVSDSTNLGEEYVGVLSSLTVFAGAAVALPAAELATRYGKHGVMIFGGICMSLVGAILYFVKDHTLSRWRVIIPYLLIYGMGRGIWENTNKAVIADLYINDSDLATAAFGAVAFSSGLSGAAGYFLFAAIQRGISATLVLATAMFSLMCYLNVTMMEERRLSTAPPTREEVSDDFDSKHLLSVIEEE